MFLEKINGANDIKKIRKADLEELAREIRKFLVENVSRTGGHLASNLGAVELTMALHLALDVDRDMIIWDVGHQSYVHKILTGRKEEFNTLRQYGGLSGFPKRRESSYDPFNTGHSTTSISAALGMASACKLKDDDRTIVAVIGDGSLTGGMAYEAMNNLSKLDRNMIIILNDNKMSISENVGGMSAYLSKVRAGGVYNDIKTGVANTIGAIPVVGDRMVKNLKRTKDNLKRFVVPQNFFEDMGITYLGPIDGHNIQLMKKIISEAKKIDHPVLIHVCTKKGKGYAPAEKHPDKFHGVGKFDAKSGRIAAKKQGPTYTDVFSEAIVEAAAENQAITAITAAMADGTGLKQFAKEYPDRFYDVGIAEEHAVTFAAGLAACGMKPFVAIYSSFLQRAYDQILHDVCLQNLPVIFCIDRAGLVGNDGETHQGLFDISYLLTIPNMNIFAPKNADELRAAVKFASQLNMPLAIRYPRGEAYTGLSEFNEPVVFGKSEMIYSEKDIAILAVGSMVKVAEEVREKIKAAGRNCSLINMRFVRPLDEEMLREISKNHSVVVTIEENIVHGGAGSLVGKFLNETMPEVKVINYAAPTAFIEQGCYDEQLKECGLDADSIMNNLSRRLGIENK